MASFAEGAVLPPREPTQGEIRAWALEQGLEVSDRGRVRAALVQQYRLVHGLD